MHRARERGMSFWPFAICLLLVLALVVMWLSVSSERDQATSRAQKAEAAKETAENERTKLIQQFQNVSKGVGFQGGGSFTDAAQVDAQLKEYGPKLRDSLKITVPVSRYTSDPTNGVVEKTDGGTVTLSYLSDAELADATSLQAFLSKFETAAKRMSLDVERMITMNAQTALEKEANIKTSEESLRGKDARIAELQQEKTAIENQLKEQTQELKDQLAQAVTQKDQKESELEQERKTSSDNAQKLIAQLNESQGQIKTLVQREKPVVTEGPDGEVIVADNGIAIINRGKNHWLQPGTVFDVWGLAKGGAKYKKGSIKVTSTDNETARGTIIEEMSARDPITRGDLIQSLVYSPNRKLHFAFVGDLKKMGRSQAEALLAKLGATVDTKVTSETNYLVVGMGENLDESEQVRTAKDLGISMITEEQLATFTRY